MQLNKTARPTAARPTCGPGRRAVSRTRGKRGRSGPFSVPDCGEIPKAVITLARRKKLRRNQQWQLLENAAANDMTSAAAGLLIGKGTVVCEEKGPRVLPGLAFLRACAWANAQGSVFDAMAAASVIVGFFCWGIIPRSRRHRPPAFSSGISSDKTCAVPIRLWAASLF